MRSIVSCCLLLCLAGSALSAPKPGPEHKRLERWVGSWTYTGEEKKTVLGSANSYNGTATGEMILGGFFLQIRYAEKNFFGGESGMQILGYDAVKKQYVSNEFDSEGSVASGTMTWVGDDWTETDLAVKDGKNLQIRCTGKFAGTTSLTTTCELSEDNKTWVPYYAEKWTKVK